MVSNRICSSKRLHLGFLAILLASAPLVGCEEAYSSLVQYAVRTDPLARSDKFGAERLDPERPGQLPLLSVKDLDLPGHPMFGMKEKLLREKVIVDPTQISAENRAQIKKTLDSWFGTPRNPKVKDAPESLKLDDKTLARGSSLYRVHCLHCHGVNGDGRGVTARWVVPHPRDFRSELFKFQSVDQTTGQSPPRREDLLRTLQYGVEATAMPAFNMLPSEDLETLVSYVIHLSMRGKVEFDTIATSFDEFDPQKNELPLNEEIDLDEQMAKLHGLVLKRWERAQGRAIKPKPYPYKDGDQEALRASVQRGYKLFTGEPTKDVPEAKSFNCVSCHKNFGREATFRWDAWGTLARPNNLADGILRGGRRTMDIYHRIHSGINGSGMPPFGAASKDDRVIWDLVNFVQVMPYPAMREKLGIRID